MAPASRPSTVRKGELSPRADRRWRGLGPASVRPHTVPSSARWPARGRPPGAGSLHSHQAGGAGGRALPGICSSARTGHSRLAGGALPAKTTTPRRRGGDRGSVVDSASATPVWIHCQCQQLLSLLSPHLPQGYRLGYLIVIRTDSASLSYRHPSSQLRHLRGDAESLLFKKKKVDSFGFRKF